MASYINIYIYMGLMIIVQLYFIIIEHKHMYGRASVCQICNARSDLYVIVASTLVEGGIVLRLIITFLFVAKK